MSNFDRCIALLIDDEGGYSDRPIKADPGGTTNWGITRRTLQRWRSRHTSRPVKITKQDVRDLTVEEATHIYRDWYWDQVRADELPCGVDYCAFDAIIQHRPRAVGRILQKACKDSGVSPGKIDGVIGPKTISAIKTAAKVDGPLFIEWYGVHRDFYYHSLPHFPDNGRGWVRRLFGVCMDARLMMHDPRALDR